jgi:hypothetical protein
LVTDVDLRARVLLVLVAIVCAASPALAEKTDVVHLENGDDLTGEIKVVERGRLKFSTDFMGTIFIEWNHVTKLVSNQQLQFEDNNGERFFGSLEEPTEPGTLRIVIAGVPADVDLDHIVRITPIKQTLVARIDGNINLGFSFTKGSNVAQLTLDAAANYRTRKFLARTSFNTITTVQEEDTTKRADLLFAYTRFHKHRKLTTGTLAFQENDELGIDLRVILSGTTGKYVLQSNNSFLLLAGGLAVNRENFIGDAPTNESLEGVFSLVHSYFRYDDPETDFTTSLTIFPSITETGRVRFEFNTSLMREIVNDFNIKLTGYDSFDNEPSDPLASRNDFGLVLTLGWSF